VGALPQALEIILVVQMKMSDEKVAREKKKKLFNSQNMSSFLLFGPLLLSKLLTFSFLVHFKQFKAL
jgi:hypothetical protein